MSTSFPHGFHGFQGLVPTTSSTTNNPSTTTTAAVGSTTTYRPGGPSPIEMTSTTVHNPDNDIECCDSNQPLTCAIAVSANSHCGDSNDCSDIPVSIAVPIYSNGQLSGNHGDGRIIAETVAVVATDAAGEDEHVMTIEALRERNRARCIGLALMLIGRTCVLLAICEVGIGGAIYSFYTNAHFGSWWSCVACALSGIWATTKGIRASTMIIASLVAVITASVGGWEDLLGWQLFTSLTACGGILNPSGTTNYETSPSVTILANAKHWGAIRDRWAVDACIASYATKGLFSTRACYCTDGHTDPTSQTSCLPLILADTTLYNGRDCGSILSYYPNVLAASSATCGSCAVLSLVLLLVIIWIVLCHEWSTHIDNLANQQHHAPDINGNPPIDNHNNNGNYHNGNHGTNHNGNYHSGNNNNHATNHHRHGLNQRSTHHYSRQQQEYPTAEVMLVPAVNTDNGSNHNNNNHNHDHDNDDDSNNHINTHNTYIGNYISRSGSSGNDQIALIQLSTIASTERTALVSVTEQLIPEQSQLQEQPQQQESSASQPLQSQQQSQEPPSSLTLSQPPPQWSPHQILTTPSQQPPQAQASPSSVVEAQPSLPFSTQPVITSPQQTGPSIPLTASLPSATPSSATPSSATPSSATPSSSAVVVEAQPLAQVVGSRRRYEGRGLWTQ